jgi:hypothetical protein
MSLELQTDMNKIEHIHGILKLKHEEQRTRKEYQKLKGRRSMTSTMANSSE